MRQTTDDKFRRKNVWQHAKDTHKIPFSFLLDGSMSYRLFGLGMGG